MVIAVPVSDGGIAEGIETCAGFDLFYINAVDRSVNVKLFIPRLPETKDIVDYLLRHDVKALLCRRITEFEHLRLKGAGIFIAPGISAENSEDAVASFLQGSLRCCVYT